MKRTTVHLPADLRARAKQRARQRGVTLAELMRRALEREVADTGGGDPFFRIPAHPGKAGTPRGLSERKDLSWKRPS